MTDWEARTLKAETAQLFAEREYAGWKARALKAEAERDGLQAFIKDDVMRERAKAWEARALKAEDELHEANLNWIALQERLPRETDARIKAEAALREIDTIIVQKKAGAIVRIQKIARRILFP